MNKNELNAHAKYVVRRCVGLRLCGALITAAALFIHFACCQWSWASGPDPGPTADSHHASATIGSRRPVERHNEMRLMIHAAFVSVAFTIMCASVSADEPAFNGDVNTVHQYYTLTEGNLPVLRYNFGNVPMPTGVELFELDYDVPSLVEGIGYDATELAIRLPDTSD